MPTYTTTSKYVQITPYMVMEFMYADQPNPEVYNTNTGSTTVSYDKLINGLVRSIGGTTDNGVQNFNQPQNYSLTKNTALNNVVRVTENSFIPLNPNNIIPFNDFSPQLTSTANLPVNFGSNFAIVYDSIRYHILAGYNLGNIDGIILGVDFLDVDGSYVTFSQIFIDSGFSGQYTLNPNPLMIGINSYDKYFEIKIPSLVNLNNQYISSPTPSLTPSALLSHSGKGFVVGSPMRIRAYEILNTTLTNGYVTYGSNLISTLSLESEDPFRNIGAFISPADTGDFFEYFGTDNGGFIEDFILFQNSIGNQYYIQNDIRVLEQIGTALIQTANFYNIQTNAYDIPNLFRPIIRNSGIASSFSLRYTMTLVNSADQSRITRIASVTFNNPAKYGSFIAPLQLQNLPQVQKIYNKVATQTNISVPNSNPTPRIIIKYSNVFFERNLVNTTMTNLVVNGTTITSADGGSVQDQTVFGQGKAFIRISPFDNYYKFTFYKQGPDGNTQLIDLETSGTYYIVFINNSNKKVSAPTIDDKNIANSSKGELAFKVSETLAMEILQYTNRSYSITNRPPAVNDPDIINGQIPTTGAAKTALASRTTALNDSIKDVTISAQKPELSLLSGTVTISANSSSVLYYGRWLKQDEEIQVTQAGPTGTSLTPADFNAIGVDDRSLIFSREQIQALQGGTEISAGQAERNRRRANAQTQNIVQTISPAIGGDFSFTLSPEQIQALQQNTAPPNGQVQSGQKLSVIELTSAISLAVRGMIATGVASPQIIQYFLNVQSPGYKLYVGITKKIFTDAVKGIFTDADLTVLNNYGNTNAGQTNGGSASTKGSNVNLTGGDNGSANADLNDPNSFQPTR